MADFDLSLLEGLGPVGAVLVWATWAIRGLVASFAGAARAAEQLAEKHVEVLDRLASALESLPGRLPRTTGPTPENPESAPLRALGDGD